MLWLLLLDTPVCIGVCVLQRAKEAGLISGVFTALMCDGAAVSVHVLILMNNSSQ